MNRVGQIAVGVLVIGLVIGLLFGYLWWGDPWARTRNAAAEAQRQLAEERGHTSQARRELEEVRHQLEVTQADLGRERTLRARYEHVLSEGQK